MNGGPGDDLIRIEMADALSGAPAVHVDGGLPDASDRLVFIDAGLGNLVCAVKDPFNAVGRSASMMARAGRLQNVEQADILPIDPATEERVRTVSDEWSFSTRTCLSRITTGKHRPSSQIWPRRPCVRTLIPLPRWIPRNAAPR